MQEGAAVHDAGLLHACDTGLQQMQLGGAAAHMLLASRHACCNGCSAASEPVPLLLLALLLPLSLTYLSAAH